MAWIQIETFVAATPEQVFARASDRAHALVQGTARVEMRTDEPTVGAPND